MLTLYTLSQAGLGDFLTYLPQTQELIAPDRGSCQYDQEHIEWVRVGAMVSFYTQASVESIREITDLPMHPFVKDLPVSYVLGICQNKSLALRLNLHTNQHTRLGTIEQDTIVLDQDECFLCDVVQDLKPTSFPFRIWSLLFWAQEGKHLSSIVERVAFVVWALSSPVQ